MLPARARVRRGADFAATVRRGRRVAGRSVVLHLLPAASSRNLANSAASSARVGFVVSRAVGPAVTRNLVRRRLRHLFRQRLTELPTGSVLVVRALPAAAGLPYDELRRDADAALARVTRGTVAR